MCERSRIFWLVKKLLTLLLHIVGFHKNWRYGSPTGNELYKNCICLTNPVSKTMEWISLNTKSLSNYYSASPDWIIAWKRFVSKSSFDETWLVFGNLGMHRLCSVYFRLWLIGARKFFMWVVIHYLLTCHLVSSNILADCNSCCGIYLHLFQLNLSLLRCMSFVYICSNVLTLFVLIFVSFCSNSFLRLVYHQTKQKIDYESLS